MRRFAFIAAAVAAAAVVAAGQTRNVTSERLLKAAAEPHNWLTYSGAYNGQRYTPLTQITAANVRNPIAARSTPASGRAARPFTRRSTPAAASTTIQTDGIQAKFSTNSRAR